MTKSVKNSEALASGPKIFGRSLQIDA